MLLGNARKQRASSTGKKISELSREGESSASAQTELALLLRPGGRDNAGVLEPIRGEFRRLASL
jgi:hypothetical protein